MKKITSFILSLCMILTLAACANGQKEADTTAASVSGEESSNEETTGGAESSAQETESEAESSAEETTGEAESDALPAEAGTGTLVVFFSCTNRTRGIAEHVINVLGADSYEIVPEVPYTDEDRDYNNSSSRCTVEQHDDSVRPAISGSLENIEDYDTIFLAYPIWWGVKGCQ